MSTNRAFPGRRIVDTFIDATKKVPDIPFEGIVDVGIQVAALTEERSGNWLLFAGMPFAADDLRYAIGKTVTAHQEVGVTSKGLRRTLPFTFELVQSGIVRAVAVLGRGDNRVETPTIAPVRAEEAVEAGLFLQHEPNRRLVSRLFGAVRARLDQEDVQAAIGPYRDNIVAISQRYASADPRDVAAGEAKANELNEQRGLLMEVVGPAIHEAVLPFADRPGVAAFAGAIACARPSDEIFAKHAEPPIGPA